MILFANSRLDLAIQHSDPSKKVTLATTETAILTAIRPKKHFPSHER